MLHEPVRAACLGPCVIDVQQPFALCKPRETHRSRLAPYLQGFEARRETVMRVIETTSKAKLIAELQVGDCTKSIMLWWIPWLHQEQDLASSPCSFPECSGRIRPYTLARYSSMPALLAPLRRCWNRRSAS